MLAAECASVHYKEMIRDARAIGYGICSDGGPFAKPIVPGVSTRETRFGPALPGAHCCAGSWTLVPARVRESGDAMKVVVVESPAKAKNIGSYLGSGYEVVASYGHVRDLREKSDSVVPEDGFRMVWEVDREAEKRIRAIAGSLRKADGLVLATDPDREGEAISWHLVETLRNRRALKKDTPVERISFHSVTREAVRASLASPREIDRDLVEAYLARRALDYLVGFRLSPVLLRKLPGARSAGRVQSVAVRLAVEREREIEAFKPREYWSAFVLLRTAEGATFRAALVELEGKKIGRYDLPDEASAHAARAVLRDATYFEVASVEAKPVRQKPAAPFITSTLQQEASRKLRFAAAQTMRTAQALYEAGFITYMRTDGVDMSPEAVSATRSLIVEKYGRKFVPSRERRYRSRAKNAQEAHECIRPTEPRRLPDQLPRLPEEQKALYRLIWSRTVASQMADAELERTTVGINAESTGATPSARLRASGQVVRFEGFRILYQEGTDSPDAENRQAAERGSEEQDGKLPAVGKGDRPERVGDPEIRQHFTKPPPRFTEASLVRRLEDLGIGRPSTYATILTVIRKRGYVEDSKRTIVPTFLGRLAVGFLETHFSRYVQYEFTAEMERELDEISGGRATRTGVLEDFWRDFAPAVSAATKLGVREAITGVEAVVEPVLFPPRSDGVDPRACPKCLEGRLALRPGRNNLFLGCDRYPDCRFVRSVEAATEGEADWLGDRELGQDGAGRSVLVRKGPFGFYLELGTDPPKRTSLPADSDPHGIDLALARQYLALPRALGAHPDTGVEIEAGIGRYGPFVRCGRVYANLPKDESVLEVGLNRAVSLIADRESRRGRGAAAAALRELGDHPEGGAVRILDGRYGPYVKWGRVSASIPKDRDPEQVTMSEAQELIAAKQARGTSGSRRRRAK